MNNQSFQDSQYAAAVVQLQSNLPALTMRDIGSADRFDGIPLLTEADFLLKNPGLGAEDYAQYKAGYLRTP